LTPTRSGYSFRMRADDDTRDLEQEVAAGQSETTPVAVITSVAGVIAVLFAIALTLAIVAYVLA
jgi:hypothetical protein